MAQDLGFAHRKPLLESQSDGRRQKFLAPAHNDQPV
jgi:hypothetical protein